MVQQWLRLDASNNGWAVNRGDMDFSSCPGFLFWRLPANLQSFLESVGSFKPNLSELDKIQMDIRSGICALGYFCSSSFWDWSNGSALFSGDGLMNFDGLLKMSPNYILVDIYQPFPNLHNNTNITYRTWFGLSYKSSCLKVTSNGGRFHTSKTWLSFCSPQRS